MNNHFFEQKDCGLQAFWSSTPQFKTARVSAHLVLPLTTPENAALYALVPNMISRATREYPDYTQFGKRLAELYGASVQPGVTRVGDNQILTLAAAGIANPYAFQIKSADEHLIGTQSICTVILYDVIRVYNVATGLGHLLAVGAKDHTVAGSLLVRFGSRYYALIIQELMPETGV